MRKIKMNKVIVIIYPQIYVYLDKTSWIILDSSKTITILSNVWRMYEKVFCRFIFLIGDKHLF